MIQPPGPPIISAGDGSSFRNGYWSVSFENGELIIDRMRLRIGVHAEASGRQVVLRPTSHEVALETGLLTRVIARGQHHGGLALSIVYDLHCSENVHIYVKLEADQPISLSKVVFPDLSLDEPARLLGTELETLLDDEDRILTSEEPWLHVDAATPFGVLFKKALWLGTWNDIGATQYTLAGSRLIGAGRGRFGPYDTGPIELQAGVTLESAIAIRVGSANVDETGHQLGRRGSQETIYAPSEEWEHFLSREAATDWLGPPILGGCLQRPSDQLVPRNLGMDILAHRRFSWNNEDLSLWWTSGKSLYWDFAIKKGQALLDRQNEHGGWYEGADFYGFSPQHHQHYNSYTSFVFLTDLFDITGDQRFADAVVRSKEFWLASPPPAIGHSRDRDDAWWYRWGGYVNEFGYTDERHALNTHASVLMIFSLLWDRFQDDVVRRGLENGANAFTLALDQGLQRGSGQFLYSLSQIDPRLERPGDPPYIQDNLIPEIENVYTVLAAFRLLVANRVLKSSRIAQACTDALNFFWRAWTAGEAKTYRCYPVKTFGLAAGQLDTRFAFALPALLRQPENWTAIYKGFSAWVARNQYKGTRVLVDARPGCVESVFLARDGESFDFALVNVGPPRRNLEVAVLCDGETLPTAAHCVDPGTGKTTALSATDQGDRIEFQLPALPSEMVSIVRLGERVT